MPLFWLSLTFLCGVLLGDGSGLSLAYWLAFAGLALILLLLPLINKYLPARLAWVSRLYRLPVQLPRPGLLPYRLIFLFLVLGAARLQFAQPDLGPGTLAWINDNGNSYVVEGIVAAPPDERDATTYLRIQAEQFHPAGELLFEEVEGKLLAKIPPGGDWRYGDRVRIQGYLQSPPQGEEFSYRDYLARQGIYSYLSCVSLEEDCALRLERDQANPVLAVLYNFREKALTTLYRLLPDPEASLLAGILLGIESGIPQNVQDAFRDTGTAHIIAISGFNITILAGIFSRTFLKILGKRRRFLAAGLSAIVISIYAIFVGASASVVRAAILGGLSLFATQLGRRQYGLNSLAFVAAIMTLINPNVLWDVGFQLSFAATLGLVLFADRWEQAFLRLSSYILPAAIAQKVVGLVGEYFLFTLAAQLLTFPITLYHFQRLSLISFLANPLILPPQPLVMIFGGLAVLLGMIWLPLGHLMAYLTWPFTAYTIRIAEVLSQTPLAAISIGRVSVIIIALFYVLVLFWALAWKKLTGWFSTRLNGHPAPSGFSSLLFLALLAITVLTWQVYFTRPDGLLHLYVLDVGSGDGLLIQTPSGRFLLVDGGPEASRLSDGLGRRLPFTHRRLDYLVVAASGDGQLAALPQVVERFIPANVLWSGSTGGTYSARQLRQALAQFGIPVGFAQAGSSLNLGSGAELNFLTVGSRGSVLWLEWGNFRALLPIGLDFDSLETLQEDSQLETVTALLLSESGYAPLNPPEWISRWSPQVVLLSVAAGDPQSLPSTEVLQSLQGYNLLRTDQNGWLHLSTNGKQLWVEVEEP